MTARPEAFPDDSVIHLSVVATSRNDNHGGYLTARMQHFVDGLVRQCKRHNVRAELVLVEWNPPPDRRPLAEELTWPDDCGPCEIRIITVPREVHAQFPHGDKLPLFQMIAKNVGIRRARGRFVLATNIDILFSDEVMLFMRDRVTEGRLYRVDRCDVPTDVPAVDDFDEVLTFCRSEAFRMHATGFTLLKRNGRWHPRSPLHAMLLVVWTAGVSAIKLAAKGSFRYGFSAVLAVLTLPYIALRAAALATAAYFPFLAKRHTPLAGDGEGLVSTLHRWFRTTAKIIQNAADFLAHKTTKLVWLIRWINQSLIRRELFTNACGDFTLLSREDWSALRGYPEWPMYSWHLDSILLYQANRNGIREVYLGKAARIFHIEHEPGSGFTPESSNKLFDRLTARGIPYLHWERDVEPLIQEMDKKRLAGRHIQYNPPNWGIADYEFPEIAVDRRPESRGVASSRSTAAVAHISPTASA